MTDESVNQRDDSPAGLSMASGFSMIADPVDAAAQAAQIAHRSLNGPADLVIGFVTQHHAQRVGMIADAIRARLSPKHLLLVSAAGIMGDDTEIGSGPGISLIAASMPGVRMHPYMLDATWGSMDPAQRASKVGEVIGASEEMAASFFFADPFSVPLSVGLPRSIFGHEREYQTHRDHSGRARFSGKHARQQYPVYRRRDPQLRSDGDHAFGKSSSRYACFSGVPSHRQADGRDPRSRKLDP